MNNRRHNINDILNGTTGFAKFALNAGGGVPVLSSTPNQTNQQYDLAAIANMLVAPDWMEQVYDLSGGYNSPVLPLLVERMGRRTNMREMNMDISSRQVMGRAGQFYNYVLGQRVIQAQVASVAASGPNLVITWNSNYSNFRNNDVVQSNTATNSLGIVISPDFTAGSITIAPVDDNTPLVIGDWNTAGQNITVIGNAQPAQSVGRSSLYDLPYPVYNYTTTVRESVQINRMDDYLTYPKTVGGKNWIRAQYDIANNWLMRQTAYLSIYSQRAMRNASSPAYTRQFMGLDASINDNIRGGIYQQFGSYPTASDFENYWIALANKRAVMKSDFLHIIGRGYLSLIQSIFTSPAILPVGRNNTLEFDGIPIKGFDAYTYAINGINHTFLLDPTFQDVTFTNNSTIVGLTNFSLSSLSCYTLDTGDFMDAEQKRMLPSMERTYFGEKMMRIGLQHGMSENYFIDAGVDTSKIGFDQVSTSQDANIIQFLMDFGYNFIASHYGCHKPLN